MNLILLFSAIAATGALVWLYDRFKQPTLKVVGDATSTVTFWWFKRSAEKRGWACEPKDGSRPYRRKLVYSVDFSGIPIGGPSEYEGADIVSLYMEDRRMVLHVHSESRSLFGYAYDDKVHKSWRALKLRKLGEKEVPLVGRRD